MTNSFDQKYGTAICVFATVAIGSLISLSILQLRVNIETASILNHSLVLTEYTPIEITRTSVKTARRTEPTQRGM